MKEKFNAVKMLTSPLQPTYWAKSFMLVLGGLTIICGLALIGFSVWKAFNPVITDVYNNRARAIYNNAPTIQPRFGCTTVNMFGSEGKKNEVISNRTR